MKAFIVVSLFFVLFAAVVGGALFLAILGIQSLNLSEDSEKPAMIIAGLAAIVVGGLLMKELHAMIERRL